MGRSRDQRRIAALGERVVAIEVGLQALDRLLETERVSNQTSVDRAAAAIDRQLAGIMTDAERFAERSQVEKVEERARLIEEAVAGLRSAMVPRGELQLRLDGVTTRQESMASTLNNLTHLLTALRSELQGQEAGEQTVTDRATRTRNMVLGVLGVLVAAAAILVPLWFDGQSQVVIEPPTTTTTVPAPAAR